MSILSITRSKDNSALDLDDGVNYRFLQYDGFGIPPLYRLSENGPLQNGTTDIGFRLKSRQVRIKLQVIASSLSTLYTGEANLISGVMPANESLYLDYILPSGSTRRLECFYVGGMELPSEKICLYNRRDFVIEFYCPNPLWYNPTQNSDVFSALADDELSFEAGFPIQFLSGDNQTITNSGQWLAYPVIYITGPIVNPIIFNKSTGETLQLGYSVIDTEIVTIDCRYGYKTITSSLGSANLIQYLSADSDLATFHIAASPEVSGGANDMYASGSGTTAASSIVFKWYTQYLGV